MLENFKITPLTVIAFVVILIGIFGTAYFVIFPPSPGELDVRRRAATPTGVATVMLDPEQDQFTVGEEGTVDIYMDTAGRDVVGIQMILEISNSNLIQVRDEEPNSSGTQIEVHDVPGLDLILNELSGSEIRLAMLSDLNQPFNTNNQPVRIASINFEAVEVGSLELVFDPEITKITQHQTGTDILLIPTNGSYQIVAESEPDPEPITDPDPEPITDPEPEPVTDPESETDPEPEPENVTEPETDPDPGPVTEDDTTQHTGGPVVNGEYVEQNGNNNQASSETSSQTSSDTQATSSDTTQESQQTTSSETTTTQSDQSQPVGGSDDVETYMPEADELPVTSGASNMILLLILLGSIPIGAGLLLYGRLES